MVSGPALAFEAVSKRFRGGTVALDSVSWSVQRGARVCLLGPNGAGKSTSIRLLEGALRPSSGRVELLGAGVGGHDYLAARRRTGVVPQGPGMYQDLTAGEYLDLVRRLFGLAGPGEEVEVFGLGPYLGTRLAELSGGFQRRVVLAAALLADPELLLLDEPTVGLDPLAAREVHDYLRGQLEGRTTLLCTHNLAEAEALCDEVVILRGGRVLIQAPLRELRARSRPQLLMAAQQGAAALIAALSARGLEAALNGKEGSVVVGVEDPRRDAPRLLRALLEQGIEVYECRPLEASLEDVFIDLVGAPA